MQIRRSRVQFRDTSLAILLDDHAILATNTPDKAMAFTQMMRPIVNRIPFLANLSHSIRLDSQITNFANLFFTVKSLSYRDALF